MATFVPEIPADGPGGFLSDLAGMGDFFISPSSAAKHVFKKWFWVGPLVVFSIVSFIAAMIMMPMMQHVMEIAPLPANSTPEQYQKGMEIGLMFQKVLAYCAPVTLAIFFALQALILLAMSAALGIGAKFRALFNVVAGCSLIQVLSAIAALVILKAKGEISTMAELRPALGFDIFLPEGANKYLGAVLGYFSVFEIWWIVMMVLVISAAFRVPKGKAFAAVVPLILLSICFRLIGAVFAR